MAAVACSPPLYAHAFNEHVPAMAGAGPSWSTTWATGGLPEPEPELRPEQQMQEANGMAMDDELPALGEMEEMMEFLPDLDLRDQASEDLVQPWAPLQHTPHGPEMDSPNVFRCDSPDSSPMSTKAATQSNPAPAQHQKQRKQVSFGAFNRVRTIPAVRHGEEIAFAFGVQPPDVDAQLKQNDGPSRSSAMMDLLLRAYFEHGATTTEYLQHVLGPENCAAIGACASELAGLCTQLADQIESAPEGGLVGVLPSNSKLGVAHAPGVRTLAQWMWSC